MENSDYSTKIDYSTYECISETAFVVVGKIDLKYIGSVETCIGLVEEAYIVVDKQVCYAGSTCKKTQI